MDPVAYLVDDGRNMAAFTHRDSAAEYAVDMQRWNGGVIPRLGTLVEASKLSAALRRELIEPLRAGLARLRADPDRFRKHNPENGWGSYDGLCQFVAEYLVECEKHPDATVEVSQ